MKEKEYVKFTYVNAREEDKYWVEKKNNVFYKKEDDEHGYQVTYPSGNGLWLRDEDFHDIFSPCRCDEETKAVLMKMFEWSDGAFFSFLQYAQKRCISILDDEMKHATVENGAEMFSVIEKNINVLEAAMKTTEEIKKRMQFS